MENNSNLFCRPDASASNSEGMHPFPLQVTSSVRARLRRFMNRQEFVGMRQSEIIDILLDREEVHPNESHSYATKRRRLAAGTAAMETTTTAAAAYQEQQNVVLIQERTTATTSLANQQEQSQMSTTTTYGFENVSQVPTTSKTLNISYYPNQNSIVMSEYDAADFDEDGGTEEILDQGQQMVLDDGNNNNYGGGRDDYRNQPQVGQQVVEHYSTDGRIDGSKADAAMADHPRAKRGPSASSRLQGNRRSVAASTGHRQWTSALRRHWYYTVAKYQRDDGFLHCRLCDLIMETAVRGVGLRAGNAFDHVCKHFGRPLFVCRICGYETILSIEVRDHIRAAHQADTRTFIDFLDANHADLERMINYCFDSVPSNSQVLPMSAAAVKEDREKQKRNQRQLQQRPEYSAVIKTRSSNDSSSARQLCYQMIIKWQRNNALYCRECDQWLRVGAKNNWLRSETAMQHICGHLGKPSYMCRLCPQTTVTSRQIRQHLQTAHKSGIRGHYVDLTESLQEELRNTAICCFDWADTEGGPPVNEGRFLKPRLRMGLEADAGRRAAMALSRRLIQDCAIDSRMHCQLCAASFVATTANGYPLTETVYNHSLKHLDPPPYACRVCSKRTHNSANMRTHIWSKHRDVDLTEFADFTTELENEILNVLTQCFDAAAIGVGGEEVNEEVTENVDGGNGVMLIDQQSLLPYPIAKDAGDGGGIMPEDACFGNVDGSTEKNGIDGENS